MLMALSSGQKAGLALVAACFIAFALVSSFLLPRYRPGYPGARLRWFIVTVLVLTGGMLSAIAVLAAETKKQEKVGLVTNAAGGGQPATAPTAPAGSPAAGKALFAAQGCSSCHTFTPAGATAKVGPDLDHLAADARKANRGSLQQYATESIVDPGAYVVPGFPNGVMPTTFGQTLSKKQVADLVAFLTQKS